MKKRILSLLLALCTACTLLVMPASAGSANSAVQAAVMLGAGQTAGRLLPLSGERRRAGLGRHSFLRRERHG